MSLYYIIIANQYNISYCIIIIISTIYINTLCIT